MHIRLKNLLQVPSTWIGATSLSSRFEPLLDLTTLWSFLHVLTTVHHERNLAIGHFDHRYHHPSSDKCYSSLKGFGDFISGSQDSNLRRLTPAHVRH